MLAYGGRHSRACPRSVFQKTLTEITFVIIFPMINDSLVPTRRRTLPRPNPLFISLVIIAFIPLAHCQCNRRSDDTGSTPNFLCTLNVTFVRQPDCSARVSESIVFPHTTGQAEERVIQAIGEIQQVSDIRLQRNEQQLSIRPRLDSDGTVIVKLPTERSTTPTAFVLSYQISNAVMRFTDGCGIGSPNSRNNVMRWRTGPLDKTVDLLSVDFSTTEERTLTLVGGNGSGSRKISIVESDFDNDPDFSVEEEGGKACAVDQVCFTRPMPIWQIGIIIGMISVPVLLVGTCIFVFTICDLCGVRPEVKGDDPVSESEMVGLRNGRYSSCIPNDDGLGGCECKNE